MRLVAIALSLGLAATAVQAQDSETLADIRQDLTVLKGELLRLKQEMNTTGTTGGQVSGGTAVQVVLMIERIAGVSTGLIAGQRDGSAIGSPILPCPPPCPACHGIAKGEAGCPCPA